MRGIGVGWLMAVASFSPFLVLAHAGRVHSEKGTIGRVDGRRVDVETADHRILTFALNAKTVCVRGEAVLAKCDATAGERVEVEFEESGATKTATRLKLPVKPDAAATSYVCPMHPEVVSDKAGRCPKCGMYLEPKKQASR